MAQTNNLSDIIEQYIKSILKQNFEIELCRQDVAKYFNVVPSQINYVIKTRFNSKHGYYVESKRGGGGYIKIVKLHYVEKSDFLDKSLNDITNVLTLKDATIIINQLLQEKVIDSSSAKVILASLDEDSLGFIPQPTQNKVRAKICKSILTKLKYEN